MLFNSYSSLSFYRWHFSLFTKISENGFQAAVDQLSLNQATMSIQIKKFESAIGVEIFDRSAFCKDYRTGELIIAHARVVLSLKKNLQKYVNEYRNGELI